MARHTAEAVLGWLLSPIADPGLVPVAAAAAIGLDLGSGEVSAQRVSQALAGRRLVLVLDTCEHMIGAVAALAEAVRDPPAGCTCSLIAVMSLRAEGEWVYPVPPLAVPAEHAKDADDLLSCAGFGYSSNGCVRRSRVSCRTDAMQR